MASRKKTTLPRTAAQAADVPARVDPKLKRFWDQAQARIKDAASRGAGAFDELWEAVAQVVEHDPPLYVLGGYASPAEFFREVLHEETRTAWRYMRVAKFATPKEEEAYGTSRLDAALGYLEAKTGNALKGTLPVAFDRLRIPVTRDGAVRSVALADASVAEVRAATRALTKGEQGVKKSAAHAAIVRALEGSALLAGVSVHERNGMLSFTQVPLGGLAKFARALLSARSGDEETVSAPKKGPKPRRAQGR